MRRINGELYHTVGEIADAAMVSRQTVRVWEAKGLLTPLRSSGGQRLFTEAERRKAVQIALLRRHRGWNPAAIQSWIEMEPPAEVWSDLATGQRLRVARRSRGLTLAQAASEVGISRSYLSAIERGEAQASQQTTSRIAEVLDMPLSSFAPIREPSGWLMRPQDRPRTILGEGVRWEELSSPGHRLEPALLSIPTGSGSGGPYVLRHETFAYVLRGKLWCQLADPESEVELQTGDAVVLPPHTTWQWQNRSAESAEVIWVEMLDINGWNQPALPRTGPAADASAKAQPVEIRSTDT